MSFIYRFFIKRLSLSSKFYIFLLQLIPKPVELSFTCYSDLIALVWGYPAWSLHEDAMFSWTLSRHASSTALQFKTLIPFSNELTTTTTTHYVVNFCYWGWEHKPTRTFTCIFLHDFGKEKRFFPYIFAASVSTFHSSSSLKHSPSTLQENIFWLLFNMPQSVSVFINGTSLDRMN